MAFNDEKSIVSSSLEFSSTLRFAKFENLYAQNQMVENGIYETFERVKTTINKEDLERVLINDELNSLCKNNNIDPPQFSEDLLNNIHKFNLNEYMQKAVTIQTKNFFISIYYLDEYYKNKTTKSEYTNKHRILMKGIFSVLLNQSIQSIKTALKNETSSREDIALIAFKVGFFCSGIRITDKSTFDELSKLINSKKFSDNVLEGKHIPKTKKLALIEDEVMNEVKACYKKHPTKYPNGIITECKSEIFKKFKDRGITYKEIIRLIKKEGKRIGKSWRKKHRKN